jgi:3-oxoacyl-[acyl-carrier-protein] synthase II
MWDCSPVETMSNVLEKHHIGAMRHRFYQKFRYDGFKVKIAAELKDFDALKYMEKSEIRRTDLFAQYALAAAEQAMSDSGLAQVSIRNACGVYMAPASAG